MGIQTTAVAYADFQAYVTALGNKGTVFSCQQNPTSWGAVFVADKVDTLVILDAFPALSGPPASFTTDFPGAVASTSSWNLFTLR